MATITGVNIYIDGVKHNTTPQPLTQATYDISNVKAAGAAFNVQFSYTYDDATESQLTVIQSYSLDTGAIVYSAEAQASFANFTGTETLDSTEKDYVSKFIDSQVRLGNWAMIKELQLNSGLSTAAKAAIGLKQGITANYNGCAYTPTTGVEADGISKYINTNLIPTTLGSSLNDAGYSFWVIDNMGLARIAVLGTVSSHASYMLINNADGDYTGKNNGEGFSFKNTKYSYDNNLYTLYRSSSTASLCYYNAQRLGGGLTTAAAGVPDKAFYLGATNNQGTAQYFNASKFGVACVHDVVGFDMQGFYFYLDILMQDLGIKAQDELSLSANPVFQYGCYDRSFRRAV